MTTIAFDGVTIAYESLAVDMDEGIKYEGCEKHTIRNGVHFFLAGNSCDEGEVIEAYLRGEHAIDEGLAVDGLVVDSGKVLCISADSGRLTWEAPVGVEAIGSGNKFALAAMDMGADAKRAVEIAISRDIYSGGEIKVFNCGVQATPMNRDKSKK